MYIIKRIDVQIFFVFLILNSITYMFSYHVLLDHKDNPLLARTHAIVIAYGSAQSVFGFISGYCIAKWWWWQSRLQMAEAEYGFSATRSVKKRKVYPDSDVDDEAHALIEGLNA